MPEKVQKDLMQAASLFEVLAEDRPDDVRDMWDELATAGRKHWQEIAVDGLKRLPPAVRDGVLKLIDRPADAHGTGL